ncbi:MAG: hypothetical protein OSB18_06895 [SAR324 cluster bacterium]|jgi:hypothetical protein|nr:hypothetical protein [SAR324 cluster bacterium]|tara:strand:- start:7989 stop:8381 length:393 start_codon:yes stop_codon:yes gene_type:complete
MRENSVSAEHHSAGVLCWNWSKSVGLGLGLLLFSGCQKTQQEMLVYERIPEHAACRHLTRAQEVLACDRAYRRRTNVRVDAALARTTQTLEYHHHQATTCQARPRYTPPDGCHVGPASDRPKVRFSLIID